MSVLSIEEFNAQCSVNDNSLKKTYRGKTLVGGPVFPLTDIKAAKSYCEIFGQKQTGEICLIVKDKSFIRIWTEVNTIEEPQESFSSLPSSTTKEASKHSTPIETEFVNNCQILLSEYVGPIAQIICKKALAKKPNSTRAEFIEILAKKISDPQQGQKFKQQLLELE